MSDLISRDRVAREIHAHAAANLWHPQNVTDLVAHILALPSQPAAETVEKVAEAIWLASYGRHRPGAKWPDGVIGGSQDLFRAHARAAIAAMGDR